jgi:hypothetical protein
MFERFIRLFKKSVTAAAPQRPQVKNEATLPKRVSFTKKEPLTTPMRMREEVQQKKPEVRSQTLLLPPAEPEPVTTSKPVAERNVSMPLPSSISGEEVAMVRHAVKNTSSERFTYVDRTHKPMVKEEPKKQNDVIKYNAKPLKMSSDHNESAHGDVVCAGKAQN